ncbi:hypothetical protein NIES4103_02210 [Nostoc sp. NIES-4103]|nr:hypothetical protein NIES4103_02210 [Nostoc sp. NIES-4103]
MQRQANVLHDTVLIHLGGSAVLGCPLTEEGVCQMLKKRSVFLWEKTRALRDAHKIVVRA